MLNPGRPRTFILKPAASKPLTYRRFEPVEPPAFTLGRKGGVAEKPRDRRIHKPFSGSALSTTPPVENTKVITTKARRHVVASRTSIKQAETHGMLDDTTGKLDPATYGMLVNRDAPLELVKLRFRWRRSGLSGRQ